MKSFIIAIFLLVAGYWQLMNARLQTILKSYKFKKAYFTTCGGNPEDWAS
jgi:hypothetical protein